MGWGLVFKCLFQIGFVDIHGIAEGGVWFLTVCSKMGYQDVLGIT